MPELIAKTALDGRSLTLGDATLAELAPTPITSIAVFPTGTAPVAGALAPLGLAMPAPNSVLEKAGVRMVWTGRDQAFLIGAALAAVDGAALTNQSDGWSVLSLTGASAADILARLLPIDLRPAVFPVGQVLRTQANHMNAIVLRLGETAFEIMVFRSMARTAWHEIEDAMHMVAARSGAKI